MNKLNGFLKAKEHPIQSDVPSPDFFEGALLGNGGLGLVVCARPDAIVLHLGHNNVWDVRIDEGHKDNIGTFKEVWSKIQDGNGGISLKDNEFYKKYYDNCVAAYTKPYPRPFPCGSIYFFLNIKEFEVLGHKLDISNGLLSVSIISSKNEIIYFQIFVSKADDSIFIKTVDDNKNEKDIIKRVKIIEEKVEGIPCIEITEDESYFGFYQTLPNTVDKEYLSKPQKGFGIHIRGCNNKTAVSSLDYKTSESSSFQINLMEGFIDEIKNKKFIGQDIKTAFEKSESLWKSYWEKSAIETDDKFLEEIWYYNSYFMNCVMSENASCPGLFGNWMYGSIGTAWHGDYHMNYNTQQSFWGVFSSNRAQLHLPYINLVEHLIPISKKWAKDFYELKGACFPHVAYPLEMNAIPYPSPEWGWEIFETPWTVQSLWWHYTYMKDEELLKNKLFPLIKEATLFMVDYILKDIKAPLNDGKYHIFPTIVPELYGLVENLDKNIDGLADLTLTKFLFNAYLEAVDILNIETEEEKTVISIKKILDKYPEYTVKKADWGDVFVSVYGEDPNNVIYNAPANLMHIFPGEEIDINSEREIYEIAKNSYKYHYNEGGNDLVFYNMQVARLGVLDVEKFKRQVKYCMLPNKTCGDRISLTGGRYDIGADFNWMMSMGIWVENFALYSVVNECFMHGHTDIITLFPNWNKNISTTFADLRAKGAFLLSASCKDGEVTEVSVLSEKGGKLKIKNPWKNGAIIDNTCYKNNIIELDTVPKQIINIFPLS